MNAEHEQLSSFEQELAANKEWIYAKQNIIAKTYNLFGRLSEEYRQLASSHCLLEEFTRISPKIYKGENYRQLPYVMLDWPRIFVGKDALAIRTLFWWGMHFSTHLIIGGKYKNRMAASIVNRLSNPEYKDWFLSVTDQPWEHHFQADNYVPLKHSGAILIPEGNYIKVGSYFPLSRWHEADVMLIRNFETLLRLTQTY